MSIRPYQREFVAATFDALMEVDRVLSVAPTGSGKTVMAGEIIRQAGRRVLFLADARELVYQAANKLGKWAGLLADVEMGDHHANPSADLVVATTQSIARRLEKYTPDAFGLIIVDEAHRNTLGAQAQSVLNYFAGAQTIGLTATPFRSDKRELGEFYQKVSDCDVGLVRLIKEGWLSRIVIKSVASGINLAGVRTRGGDFREDDLGAAIVPHLDTLARILAEHAPDRRTVAFLPLRETSRQFVEACRLYGLRAIHVDGDDRDGIKHFRDGSPGVISNAQLLSTGWDEPCVDCVFIARPTKSFTLYSQMVGRGTRIFDGKKNLLVLDPLFLDDEIGGLIRPARLIAKTEADVEAISKVIDEAPGLPIDLFDAEDAVEAAEEKAKADRAESLRRRMVEVSHRRTKTVDALEYALALDDPALAEYEPETQWEAQPPTEKQLIRIEAAGFEIASITCRGHASKIIDQLVKRRELGLATPKQLKWLIRKGHPSPNTATFAEANAFLDAQFGKGNAA